MNKIIFSAAVLAAACASAQNTGIGTTAPKAKLDVIGGIRVLKGLPTTTADGSNIGYAFDQDGDTGMFADGTNPGSSSNIIFYSDNQPRLFIGGNLKNGIGIGTVNPAANLDVVGNFKLTDGTQGAGKVLTSDANGLAKWLTPAVPPVYAGSTSVILNGTSFERAALTGDVTAAQNSNATTIAANAVTSAKIADGTIAAADFSAMGATAGQVMKWNGTQWVAAADVDTNTTYTASASVALNGTSFERAALTGDVTAVQNSNATTIAPNAVTSAKIADGTIAAADLSAMGATAAGQNLTWNGTAWVPTAPSVTTNIYTADGSLGGNRTVLMGSNNLFFTGAGKVGVGNNAPAAKLDVSGGLRAMQGIPNANDGSDRGYAFGTDGDSGLFSEGTTSTGTNLSFYLNNQRRLIIDNNGRVGIGTDSPAANLDIAGNFKLTNGSQGANKVLVSDANGLSSWQSLSSLGSVTANLYNADGALAANRAVTMGANSLTFNGTAPFTINTTAYVNYLNVNPQDADKEGGEITLLGTTNSPTAIRLDQFNNNFRIFTGSRVLINSNTANGYTGIGTANPNAQLDVAGGARVSKGAPANDLDNKGYAFEQDGDTGLFAEGGSTGSGSTVVIRKDSSAQISMDGTTTTVNNNLTVAGNQTTVKNLQIKNGTEGAGKLLYSDANGNASWGNSIAFGTTFIEATGIFTCPFDNNYDGSQAVDSGLRLDVPSNGWYIIESGIAINTPDWNDYGLYMNGDGSGNKAFWKSYATINDTNFKYYGPRDQSKVLYLTAGQKVIYGIKTQPTPVTTGGGKCNEGNPTLYVRAVKIQN